MTFNARSLISIKPPSPLTAAAVFVFSKLCSANSRAFRALVIFAERSFTISKKSLLVLVMFRPEYICPHCGAGLNKEPLKLVKRDWPEPWRRTRNPYDDQANFVHIEDVAEFYGPDEIAVRVCSACGGMSLFVENKIVWPVSSGIKPYEGIPEAAKRFFEEAQSVLRLSPRSCCALLRVSLEAFADWAIPCMSVKDFDSKSSLNNKIDALKVSPLLKERLHNCRAVGNDSAHPGFLELSEKDTVETAIQMTEAINDLFAVCMAYIRTAAMAKDIKDARNTRKNKS